MKKILRPAKKALFYICLIFVCISLSECKKETFSPTAIASAGIDSSLNFTALTEENRIKPQEVEAWIKSLPGELPFKVQWALASQKIINGKHVIAVPINKSAAMFFTKEKGKFKAFAYRWTKVTPNEKFTGAIQVIDFQHFGSMAMIYDHDQLIKVGLSPDVLDANASKDGLNTKTTNAIKTNNIFKWLEKISCYIVGGEWDDLWYDYGLGPGCTNWFSYTWLTGGGGTSGSSNINSYGLINVYGLPEIYRGDPNYEGQGAAPIGVGDAAGMYSADLNAYQIVTITGDGKAWLNVWAIPDQSGCPTGASANKGGQTNTFNPHDCDAQGHWGHFPIDPEVYFTASDLDDATYDDVSTPRISLSDYLKCFDDGKPGNYKLTLYINQPNIGTNDQFDLSLSTTPNAHFNGPAGVRFAVGHVFIGFEKDEADGTIINQNLGYYPSNGLALSSGQVKDDSGHKYNISYSISVTQAQFNAAFTTMTSDEASSLYRLGHYNCADAALNWINQAGASIPGASRGLFLNSPGDLGEAIKSTQSTAVSYLTDHTAPASHGPCN